MLVGDRNILGFKAKIEIHMDFSPDRYRVVITDAIGETTWEPDTREQAKDMFFHPFAYGYTDPIPQEDAA